MSVKMLLGYTVGKNNKKNLIFFFYKNIIKERNHQTIKFFFTFCETINRKMHNRTTLQGKHASQSHCGEEKNVFFYFSFLFNFLILFFVKHCLRIGKKEIKNQKQVNDMIFAFANYMENNSEKLKRNKMKIKWSSEKTNVMRMRNENPFFYFFMPTDYECEFVMQALTTTKTIRTIKKHG